MPDTAYRRRRIDTGGPWGTGLLIAGLGSVILGLFYVFAHKHDLPPAMQWITEIVPIPALGGLWIIAGGYCVFQALTPPQQHWHIAPIVAVMDLWAGIYMAHWLVLGAKGTWGHDWQSCLVWSLFAAMLISWGRCVNPPRRRR